MRVGAAVAAAVLLTASDASAHGSDIHAATGGGALSIWDLAVVAVLLVSGTLYLRGAWHLAKRGAVHHLRERLAFWCGWLVLVATVLPPLDAMAVELFSAHMLQHELMMLVGAPLVMAGRPLSTCLWGVPAAWRGGAAAAMRVRPFDRAWRWSTAPAVAWIAHGAVIWVWHIPALYDAAVANEGVHAVQHAMFVGTAALFWWGLLYGRYGRAGYGAAVFYVFTTVVHTGLLGAMLTFAGAPLYASYRRASETHGVTPLEDQQLAGLLMWIPAGIILTLLGIALFAAWVGESERRQRQAAAWARPEPRG